jgi:ABC-type polysaccharide/polyol phosphate transport system ATPase subunit
MIPLRFENVSKMYRRHHAAEADDDFWAVRDVSFDCHEGDVLGLVGRNGCGKSTILKLAAGVTVPTTGSVSTVKPIAPMLELGAGFHPDLTGRDNIRLNGSLLGMGRRISKDQFDSIVAFAELEAHIDTPVKHYSSGMSARLGFAIAVHSTARLLLIDEVLSVGDKLFQQKCLARMIELRDTGTTILLVSHDDAWIRNFCTRALLIDKGTLIADTTPDNALHEYDLRLYQSADPIHHGASIEPIEFSMANGEVLAFRSLVGDGIHVRIPYDASGLDMPWEMVVRIRRQDGEYPVMSISPPLPPQGTATLDLGDLRLVAGRYLLEVSIEHALSHSVLATRVSDYFHIPGYFDATRGYHGTLLAEQHWTAG